MYRLQFISKQKQCISCDAILFYKKERKKERKTELNSSMKKYHLTSSFETWHL